MSKNDVKVINVDEEGEFETQCKQMLDEGYKMRTCSCGFGQSEEYVFCARYIAIFVKEN